MKVIARGISGFAIGIAALIGLGGRAQAGDLQWTTGSPMPTPRESMGGAVIGTKIYIVGGCSTTVFDSVEVLDTTENSWSVKASLPKPKMTDVVAVEGKIYAIGGRSGTIYFDTFDRYDPLSDTWTSLAPMEKARFYHAVVPVGKEIYLISGITPSLIMPGASLYTDSVEKYNTDTGVWSACVKIPTPRSNAAAAVVGGTIYVIGGVSPDYIYSNRNSDKVEAYDVATDTWSTKASIPTGRCGASAAVVDGKIYVVGGRYISWNGSYLSTVEVYDPVTDTWTVENSMPTPRADFTLNVISGKLYAIGGNSGYPDFWVGTNEIGVVNGLMSSLIVSPAPVVAFQSTTVQLEVINNTASLVEYLTPSLEFSNGDCTVSSLSGPWPSLVNLPPGSSTAFNWQFTTSLTGALKIDAYASGVILGATVFVHEWYSQDGADQCDLPPPCDETNLNWTWGKPMNVARWKFAAETVANRIYVFGGGTEGSCIASSEKYDPATDMWSYIAPKPTPGWGSVATAIGSTIYVMGGGCSTLYSGSAGNKVEAFDTVNNIWWSCPNMPAPRWNAAAAAVDGIIYLFGGNYNGETHYTTWAFDPKTGIWSTKAPMTYPLEAMGTAVLNKKIYVIGGQLDCEAGCTTYNVVFLFDPLTNKWEAKDSLEWGGGGKAVGVIDGKIYVAGGISGLYDIGISGGEVYDSAANLWKEITRMPLSREYLRGSVINNKFYAIGGNSGIPSATVMVATVCSVPPLPPEPLPTPTPPPPGPPAPTGDDMLYVYPHPLKCPGGYAVFDMDKQGTASLRVMNMRGQVVKEITASLPAMENAQVYIDCSEVGTGAYMLNGVLIYNDGTVKWLKPYKFVVAGGR